MAIKKAFKIKNSAVTVKGRRPVRAAATKQVEYEEDIEMLSDVEEDPVVVSEEEEPEEEQEQPEAVEDGAETQVMMAKLVKLGKESGLKKLKARQSKADESLERCDEIFDVAARDMKAVEASKEGSKGHRDKVVAFHVVLDQHVKASKLNAEAIKRESSELQAHVERTVNKIEHFASHDLTQYMQFLKGVLIELQDRAALLQETKQKQSGVRKKAISRLKNEDPIQTQAIILIDTLRKLKVIV